MLQSSRYAKPEKFPDRRHLAEEAHQALTSLCVSVKNEDLVKDQILTQSNAYIESYKIAKENTSTDGLVSVTILADVRKRDLTKKIRDVIPAQTIDLSDVSKNLHAQIITDSKANNDALSIIRNELKDFQPLKQLIIVSLASKQPIVESVKDDSSLVRLWYPIKVEVDTQKYYQEFAPRWFRILNQIKTAPALLPLPPIGFQYGKRQECRFPESGLSLRALDLDAVEVDAGVGG